MKNKNFKIYILSAVVSSILLVPSILSAQNGTFSPAVIYQGTSVGIHSSIFGFGANAKVRFNDAFGVRAGFEMANADDIEVEADELTYNFDVELQNMMFLADFHPWQGSFRTSAGLMVNNSNVDGRISPNKNSEFAGKEFTFNDVTYSVDDIGYVDTKVDFDPVAPYIGIGWDTSFNKVNGFGFTFDVGVVFQGSARVEYDVHYAELPKTENGVVDAKVQETRNQLIEKLDSDLKEEKKVLDEELENYEILPYISIGVNYKF